MGEAVVGGDQGMTAGERLGRDQEIVAVERQTLTLQPGAQFAIDSVDGFGQRQYIEPRERLVDPPGEPYRTTLGSAKAQFGGDDDAGQNIGFAALADAPRDGTLPVPARQ